MKPLLTFLAISLGVGSLAYAGTGQDSDLNIKRVPSEPTAIIGVYDTAYSPAQAVVNATLSKNSATHRLCWKVEGLTPDTPYNVSEHILSPSFATFADKEARNGRSPDGLYHRILKTTSSSGHGDLQKCWRFDKTDPNGEYQIQLAINDLIFPVRIFYVAD